MESIAIIHLLLPAPLLQPQPYHLLDIRGPGAEDLSQDLLGGLQLLAPGVYGGPWCPGPPALLGYLMRAEVVWLAIFSEMLLPWL
jgi:hypothetical protein